MADACPIPTPAQRHYGEIQSRIEQELLQRIRAAIDGAAEQARAEIQATGVDLPMPSARYFMAAVHQKLFCALCDADPDTFVGGRPEIALPIIRNAQNIARHYWGAETS